MAQWLVAGLWGTFAGGALLVGAILGYPLRVPGGLVAAIMAFGSGVLISALAFELVGEANERGGLAATATGFLAGASIYTLANLYLARRGARRRKRSDDQPSEAQQTGSGLSIALGALLDGIPESMVIGLGLLDGGAVSGVMVAAIFLSNLPEGLASAVGMKRAGRSARYVLGVWGGIALASGLAAIAGNLLFAGSSPQIVAVTTALAAGAILAMLVDTMIPEAFERAHNAAGLITAVGFLVAFALSRIGG